MSGSTPVLKSRRVTSEGSSGHEPPPGFLVATGADAAGTRAPQDLPPVEPGGSAGTDGAPDVQRLEEELAVARAELESLRERALEEGRLEAISAMVSRIAHEVKNPLGVLMMGAEYLVTRVPVKDATVDTVLADMRNAVARADSIVRGVVYFSAMGTLIESSEDLNEVVESVLQVVRDRHGGNIAVEKKLAPGLPPVVMDREKIQQALGNVLANAMDAMPGGGTITVQTARESADPECGVNLVVADTGGGIPAHALGKIFDPFYSARKSGRNAGLGLTIARRIFHLHGATIAVANCPGGGAQVTVTFKPRTQTLDHSGARVTSTNPGLT